MLATEMSLCSILNSLPFFRSEWLQLWPNKPCHGLQKCGLQGMCSRGGQVPGDCGGHGHPGPTSTTSDVSPAVFLCPARSSHQGQSPELLPGFRLVVRRISVFRTQRQRRGPRFRTRIWDWFRGPGLSGVWRHWVWRYRPRHAATSSYSHDLQPQRPAVTGQPPPGQPASRVMPRIQNLFRHGAVPHETVVWPSPQSALYIHLKQPDGKFSPAQPTSGSTLTVPEHEHYDTYAVTHRT